MLHFYLGKNKEIEYCFNVETSEPLSSSELAILRQLLADGFVSESISSTPSNHGGSDVVELGPRMNFATAYSTNLVAICQTCGLEKVVRIERSRRYPLSPKTDKARFVREHHDRMTECLYPEPLKTFETGLLPESVFVIPMMEKGPNALMEVPGLAMDEWDRNLYFDYFVKEEGRNPTIVEIRDLDNANSEHSRHGYFKGKQIINGVVMPETLMEIVQSTLRTNPSNSISAFRDNSSAIKGYDCWTIIPEKPGKPSPFVKKNFTYHIIFTAETHNFPTGVAPFPGAETGTGGRIRDIQAMGKGGLVITGTAGYCVANLLIPGYDLPWENKGFPYPSSLATPLAIEIRASDGASDYGNKFGEPVILGFTRSFDQRLPNNERWAWIKPIMFTGGVGQVDALHIKKGEAEKGMLIVQIGGPAYGIGIGGGSASSKLQGENEEDLDFNAVQRGDAEMEQKMNRVIRACIEMGENNPIVSIHDQGAGGPANVLKELVEKTGGRIELRRIKLGDSTLSVLKIWIAEYQERCGLLIASSRIDGFKSICEREKVNCEVLGEVTGDGRFIVHDEQDDSTPVNLDLGKVLGNMPQKTFKDERIDRLQEPFELPQGVSVEGALYRVLHNLAVGSKRFLTNKVDRSVTGLIARQQCCGPLQLTVSDVAVIAQSHFGLTGAATSIGEQPIKMLVNPEAGARMAVAEALTNIVWAQISGLEDVKCSANWMWAPKLPGEGAALYDAACAMRDLMIQLGVAVDRGKDSLSMATRVGDEIVKSPRELVISAYATMPDITKVVTPDIKRPGQSELVFLDLSSRRVRLGGSVLAQVYSQLGNESPDVDNPKTFKRAFLAVQKLISENLILAGHDVSDGGIITTFLEMAFAGNCGLEIGMDGPWSPGERLFSEELGLVFECGFRDTRKVFEILATFNLYPTTIGRTTEEKKILVTYNSKVVLKADMPILRQWWEDTSYQIERLQMNPECADEERKNIFERTGPKYNVSFEPKLTLAHILETTRKFEVAILREEGSNGDREMTSVFYQAGFKPWDVTMTDLISGRTTLEQFRGLVAVGGFSYADVPESAKGWAATIRFNERLKKMFEDFYKRPDTFSLGVCNGCQLFALLGWVPWFDLPDEKQPRFVQNLSRRFESRWVTVKIQESPAMMFKGMADSVLGVWVAHGEGRLYFPDTTLMDEVIAKKLVPMVFVDDKSQVDGVVSENYPFNPNGSPFGITGLCSPDGRHLAIMPHPERAFLKWQWPWMPEYLEKKLEASPWLQMFQNARDWCNQAR
ncbi:MAG: phosphoribosylformylglycinamidine synthase [Candidatus Nealsonbacteria bacterium CG_4_10_14_0_2_um_filter_38_17]|uniref:Phosphoribosylformylglycinamidine synthase n=2 Tax=Candidatus Nealsoniibacteriota TaxID=1817911 RepID=A0A2M7UXH4_9BACT|nr:MAG: phosphoribosylformylglycinamidine synthase [Candidatus Nealsonbacteria bacterium CG23_combo_of_CG06-09_8_20_14_all_38_19]PIZ88669.1 MAG: phosphoribosylformylglycinamidine synthase [Candidatus Nealsonbacteria bacterium CG_4_10_14_0_2_um_filter_38_17]